MAFPCPICGSVAKTRSSRMLSATTKETYYNCSNDDCCHQFKTMESDPVTLAQPIKGGKAIDFTLTRKLDSPKKKHQEAVTKPEENTKNTAQPGQVIHILAG